MNQPESYFDLYGAVGVVAEGRFAPYLRHYLRSFEVSARPSEIMLEVRGFSESQALRPLREAGGFVEIEGGVAIPGERYAVVLGRRGVVEFTEVANRATPMWLDLLLARRRMALVHAAAFRVRGVGILLPALGGVGKTALLAHLRSTSDAAALGDDFVMIAADGTMSAFPADLSLYPYHLPLFPELEGTVWQRYLRVVGRRERWRRRFDGSIGGAIGRRALARFDRILTARYERVLGYRWDCDYVKVPLTQVLPPDRICRSSTVDVVVSLARTTARRVQVEDLSFEQAWRAVAGTRAVEFRHGLVFLHLMTAFGWFDSFEHEHRQGAVLREALGRARILQLSVPREATPSEVGPLVAGHLSRLL